jgi:hypothetical protein
VQRGLTGGVYCAVLCALGSCWAQSRPTSGKSALTHAALSPAVLGSWIRSGSWLFPSLSKRVPPNPSLLLAPAGGGGGSGVQGIGGVGGEVVVLYEVEVDAALGAG